MKKIILPVFVFAAFASAAISSGSYAVAQVAGTPEARAIYSPRPYYRRPMPQRQYIVEDKVLEPALAPEVPTAIEPNLDPRNMRSLTAPVPPSTGAYVPAQQRPLSNVGSIEKPPVGKEKPLTPPNEDTPNAEETKPVRKPKPAAELDVFSSGSAVDKMNVRLAKIQLEKKNLPETLKLIDRISTPMFKVATLVEFAEYVSRDSNYRKEAEQLYALAINGIDALQNNKPVVILVPAASVEPALDLPKAEPPSLPKVEPVQKEFTVIDEAPAKPVVEPVKPVEPAVKQPEPVRVETVKPEPVLSAPIKTEEPKPEAKPVVKEEVKAEEPKPEPKPVVKPVLEPLDEIEPAVKQNEKPPVEKPAVEDKPIKEPTLAPEPAEVKPEPVKKPSFIVPAPAKVEEPKPVTKPEVKPELVNPNETEKKPSSRPLPKKTIKLEEN